MDFKKLNQKIQSQFLKMCATGMLFRSSASGQEIWDVYLASFKNETIFRDPESSEHNCNNCKNFIRRYGNIVSINEDGEIESLFSNIGDVGEYTNPIKAIDEGVLLYIINGVFFETYKELNENLTYESCKKTQSTFKLGVASNFKKYTQEEVDKFGVVDTTTIYEFNHFHLDLPKEFVDFSGDSIEKIMASYKDKYVVFKRAMEEIPLDTLSLVEDLINQGSLLDGAAHLHSVRDMSSYIKTFEDTDLTLDVYCWIRIFSMDERTAKFKNTLIGVLCTELAEGMELNKACENWNKRVDPVNYHKVTAPITQKQIAEAKKFVQENGYEQSFERRLATIDDIKASEILHLNSGDGKVKDVSMFDSVKASSTRHKRSEFNKLEEVPIEKFMSDILPSCTSIQAYLENRMGGNLVTLTKAVDNAAKQITKWNGESCNYSWTFNGNLAGKSQIKQAVKDAGGNVEGVLNFRLAWNDETGTDSSDLDAWAREPDRTEIGYSTGFRKDQGNSRTPMSGQLDVDNTNPQGKLAVENITWIEKSEMQDGEYKLWVHQYSARNSQGFKAEIEFEGEVYLYEYNQPVAGNVSVANVTLKDGQFSIKHLLPETHSSKEVWGLETNQFHKVNLICKSPNHWGENAVGNQHFMFMLADCKVDTPVRGFHNENLLPDLLKHKKVLEVLGATNMIEPSDKQLSGVGFNATVRDELVVKCAGSFKRMIKIKF